MLNLIYILKPLIQDGLYLLNIVNSKPNAELCIVALEAVQNEGCSKAEYFICNIGIEYYKKEI